MFFYVRSSPFIFQFYFELVEEVVNEVDPVASVMTVVKSEGEESPRKLTKDEKIQR